MAQRAFWKTLKQKSSWKTAASGRVRTLTCEVSYRNNYGESRNSFTAARNARGESRRKM